MSKRLINRFALATTIGVALLLATFDVGYAFPSNHPATCASSSCHNNPLLASAPDSGGTLSFGSSGFTLVGQSSIAAWTLKNDRPVSTGNGPANKGGGFSGSFPSTPNGSEFSAGASSVIVGNSGYLTPQLQQSQTYSYAPTARGQDSLVRSFTPTNGFSSGQVPTVSVTLQGQGVAPVLSVIGLPSDAGHVRLGTSGSASILVTNAGDGNLSGLGVASNLQGSVSAAGSPFAGGPANFSLGDGASQQFDFSFTPTSRGATSADVTVASSNGHGDGSNLAQSLQLQLDGTGVGPQYSASVAPDATVDFGSTSTQALRTLSITNATPDADLGALTGLTLRSFLISGPDASFFSLSGFAPGTVLAAGDAVDLGLMFSAGGTPGMHAATLLLRTDENAALGQAGNEFSYTLAATEVTPVPEPHSMAMLLAGLCVVGMRLRNRRRI